MNDQEIKKHKEIIDNMGHVGMARLLEAIGDTAGEALDFINYPNITK